jgi:hypothetical protein
MSNARRNRMVYVASISLAILLGFMFRPSDSRGDAGANAPAVSPAKLQQERIATLRKASELAHTLYRQGTITWEENSQIDQRLLDAQLESADSQDTRTKLLTAALDVARQQEQVAAKRQQAGYVSTLVPLQAKADRLRIEIALARAASKE